MLTINQNFTKLQGNYLFAEIARRVAEYKQNNPGKNIISLGIGDVTKPLCPAVIKAMHKAVDEMANAETFRGYGPYEGHEFLRNAIIANDYKGLGISTDEVFVSDGAKCDTSNMLDIIGENSRIAVTDPVYPVYVDTNVMAGHSGKYNEELGRYAEIEYLTTDESNNFCPSLPRTQPDVVYLCSPNNPTGMGMTRANLKEWIDWARKTGALIMFDAAYERFIESPDVPHSIYEMDGAQECAIEFRSFSKTAGFTGIRCGFAVVPKALMGQDESGKRHSMNSLFMRRQATKFNGASYIVQRGAEAIYSPEGAEQVNETVRFYKNNAKMILEGLRALGFTVYGGVDSPYVWVKTPMDSWDFFDKLLTEANVVGTPGSGFGAAGQGFFRLTAFNTKANTREAISRIGKLKL